MFLEELEKFRLEQDRGQKLSKGKTIVKDFVEIGIIFLSPASLG